MAKLDLKIFPYAANLPVKSTDLNTKKKLLDHLKGLFYLNQIHNNKDLSKNPFPLTLVSSISGKIKNLVFHYDDMTDPISSDEPALYKIIERLIEDMSDVNFFIVSNKMTKSLKEGNNEIEEYLKRIAKETKEGKKQNRINFPRIGKDDYKKFSEWASDTYKAAYDNNNNWYLVEPYTLMSQTNKRDAKIFCEHIRINEIDLIKGENFICELIGLSFDGGNILVGDEFVLIGSNIEEYNKTGGISRRKLIEALPELVNYMAEEGMKMSDIALAASSFSRKDNSKELLEEIESFEKSINPFPEDWKKILLRDDRLLNIVTKILDTIDIKYFFERLLGGKGRKFFFVGNTIENRDEYYVDKEEFHISALRSSLKGEENKQPLFHLDLFITLAGRLDKKYQLVIGKPVVGLSDKKLATLSSDILGIIYTQICKMNYYINETIQQLLNIEEIDFEIIRTPLPLTYNNFLTTEGEFKFNWYWASYNNSLVEIDDEKKIWIPSYSHNQYKKPSDNFVPTRKLKEAFYKYHGRKKNQNFDYGEWSDLALHQAEVQRVWNNLGFTVKFIKEEFNWYAHKNGALACLVNCVKRNIL